MECGCILYCITLTDLRSQESDTPWATRWDNYLHIFDPKIHWFSLINSIIIVVFLCVMVSMILLRSVSRDVSHPPIIQCVVNPLQINRYNAIDLSVRFE